MLLTITARYADGGQGAALAQAASLARQAGTMGRKARIVVEASPPNPRPGTAEGIAATLAYDQWVDETGTRFALHQDPSTQP